MENDAAKQYLTFFLADEQYAVGVLSVKEIIEYGIVTKVPTTPPYIRGVINLRGSVVPVIDLAVKFGLPAVPVSRRTCIVIMETTLVGEEERQILLGCVVLHIVLRTAGTPHPPTSDRPRRSWPGARARRACS